jgi:hypothetical protein
MSSVSGELPLPSADEDEIENTAVSIEIDDCLMVPAFTPDHDLQGTLHSEGRLIRILHDAIKHLCRELTTSLELYQVLGCNNGRREVGNSGSLPHRRCKPRYPMKYATVGRHKSTLYG